VVDDMSATYVAHTDSEAGELVRRRVAIVAGGTAGHVYPALALADAYRQARTDVDLLFIGTADGWETRLVPAHGYRLEVVPGSPLYGVGLRGVLRAARDLLAGTRAARRLLQTQRTELVIGFGGYVSAGTILAARMLGLRTAIHEANVVPGLTNRLVGHLVDRVYLAFAEASRAFPLRRTVVTGMPLRAGFANAQRSRDAYGASRPRRLLVTGGSGGSRFLNERVPELAARIAQRAVAIEVLHQAGDWPIEPVQALYAATGTTATVVPFIDDIGAAYAWADFAVTCAGAGTLAELAAAALPALLVPLASAAADHQTRNAEAFARAAGLRCVAEAAWQTDALAEYIVVLLQNADAWAAAAARVGSLAHADAAVRLVADCEALLNLSSAGPPAS
jgi:UDP-N-acetylglucosamine--N-acetylmuramyl-(pentapeptide) pyrophosphoryl-undecaprenol N-acetylglucosamine transferase